MRLLQIHLNIIKYLRQEFRKARTFVQWIRFIKVTCYQYYNMMLKEYKNLFLLLDPTFQKQKKEFEKQTELKKDLHTALKLLQWIDTRLAQLKMNRSQRRAFWRYFIKNGELRKETFDQLMKQYNL